MEYLVNSQQMKDCDSFIINNIGVPSMVLMERAALSCVEELYDNLFNLKKVLVVCGSGNNGGDGFAVARLLHLRNVKVHILFIGHKEKCTVETRHQMEIVKNYNIEIFKDANFNEFDNYTTIIDGVFGVGLSKKVEGKYVQVIEKMNGAEAKILSLDIPSGISADTGRVMGVAVKATKTVTFAYKKLGLVLYPGRQYAGEVKLKDIGITDIGFGNNLPKTYSYNKDDLIRLPKRLTYSNKGTYGKVLVIAGAVNMAGAAYFSAKATYKMGAGLVNMYIPHENRAILQTMLPEAILTTYDSNNIDENQLKETISWASVIVMGPGMGNNETTKQILEILLCNTTLPLIIDADGINVIAKHPYLLKNHKDNIIITPHLGEMARLINKDIEYIAENIIEVAEKYAQNHNVVCVLKDAVTVVANGRGSIYLNQSGNNGMATGGSGDVLTGIIAGLLAQGMGLLESSALGVYIHGLAGDRAAFNLGRYSLIADDIIDNISYVLKMTTK